MIVVTIQWRPIGGEPMPCAKAASSSAVGGAESDRDQRAHAAATSPSKRAGRPEDVLAHHEIIERRREKAGAQLGELIAGDLRPGWERGW